MFTVRQATWSVAVLLLGACAIAPAGLGMMRDDVDMRSLGQPPVKFNVDCTPLRSAAGGERELCYASGAWCKLDLASGTVLGCNCGEFGGFLQFYPADGGAVETLIRGDTPKCVMSDGLRILCVTGRSHLSLSAGAVYEFELAEGRWRATAHCVLPTEPEAIDCEGDGPLRLELFDGSVLWYSSGTLGLEQ